MVLRFTLRELFAAVTLIGAGVGGLVLVLNPQISRLGVWSLIVLLFSPGMIAGGLGVLVGKANAGWTVGLLLGLVLAGIDATAMVWSGRTNLEIRFVVTARDTGEPVPFASVEIQPHNEGIPVPVTADVMLVAGEDGVASTTCPDTMCYGRLSGLGTVDTFGTHVPAWRFRIVASGFRSSPWVILEETRYRTRRVKPGEAELVIPIALERVSDATGATSEWLPSAKP